MDSALMWLFVSEDDNKVTTSDDEVTTRTLVLTQNRVGAMDKPAK